MAHVASCGCTLTAEEGLGYPVTWIEYDAEWNQCLVHATYCRACYEAAQQANNLLTQEQIDAWHAH